MEANGVSDPGRLNYMEKAQLADAAVKEIRGRFEDNIRGATSDRPFVFGLGSGSTVAAFWPCFAEYLLKISARHIIIIPTSYQSRDLVMQTGPQFPLGDIRQHSEMDLLVDGFDELEENSGNMIKGGGGAHVLEKLVALSAKNTIYLGSKDKQSNRLGTRKAPIPVETVLPAVPFVQKQLSHLGGTCKVRPCAGGKLGPVVTDLGNVIIDVSIPPNSSVWDNVAKLEHDIECITGVIGCGLFVNLADLCYLADEKGSITVHSYNRCK
jgi:ribose 5-phosphate isomerase A